MHSLINPDHTFSRFNKINLVISSPMIQTGHNFTDQQTITLLCTGRVGCLLLGPLLLPTQEWADTQ